MRKFLLLFFSLFAFALQAQKLAIDRFEETNNLAARQYPRKDYNGELCALIKIEVMDKITEVEFGGVGEVIDKGVEKWVYIIAHQRYLKFHFAQHFSVEIDTRKYDINGLVGGTTYALRLVEEGAPTAPTATSTATPQPSPKPKAKAEDVKLLPFTVNGVTFNMVRVEGGTFMMGAADDDSEAVDWDKPRHKVKLSDYYIGQTEVTQALWQAVMGSNPSNWKGGNLPVEQVSWDDCQTFISKLNALTGQSFSLPTEAEWEFAARGGNKSRGYKYSGSNDLDAIAWYYDNSSSKPHTVATKQANELGIYDMSGNVFEWCSDWFERYSSTSQTNPTDPTFGSIRMFRGGGWSDYAWFSRVSNRYTDTPTNGYNNLGLRLSIHK